MSKSKNDFEFFGGHARVTLHTHKKQYEAKFMLLNPETNKPYTNFELIEVLKIRQEENPQLSQLVEPWIKKLLPKAETKPASVFAVYAKGKDKSAAKIRVMELHGQEMKSLGLMVFRPLYEQNLTSGNLTVNHYVLYQKESLFNGELPDVRTRLIGCLNNYILPEIGNVKLKHLDQKCQEKALRAINRTLSKQRIKSTLCGYVRRAYRGLLVAIESSGWKGCYIGMRLADLITQSRERNTAIRNNARVGHLDHDQRADFFRLLQNPDYLRESFIVGLIYSGLSLHEIAAARFDDFEVLEFQDNEVCYTLMVTKQIRKLHNRYSTVGATNEAYPIAKYRRIVLYPWAGCLMLKWLETLRNKGYSENEIKNMRLTDSDMRNPIIGPEEISNLLVSLMQQAGLKETSVTRTNKNGEAYLETLPLDVELLRRDARHMAAYCGADSVMEHAMFGDSWTETDEQAYLDLLCDEYAVARYHHLRRWSPYVAVPPYSSDKNSLVSYGEKPARYTLTVTNPTDHSITLTLSGAFATNVEWRNLNEEFNHENKF